LSRPIYSEAAFDRAVDAVLTSAAVKDRAKTYEARVWGNAAPPPRYVEQYGLGLEFWVEQPRLTANVQLEPTYHPVPAGLTTSEKTFLYYCHSVDHDSFVAQSAYDIVNRAYRDELQLGATAAGSGDIIWASVYGPDVTTTTLVEPASL
jgi:hypothetical protein